MRILLMLGNGLLSGAFKRLLAERCPEHEIREFSPSRDSGSGGRRNEVVIADYFSLAAAPKDALDGSKVIAIDEGMETKTAAALFAGGQVMGIIRPDADLDTFLKAVEAVRKGEIWIDSETLKALIAGPRNAPEFSGRESQVIGLLRQGRRNKEIASALAVSEQTVKSHLNRIFRKMNVSGRTELLIKLAQAERGPV